MGEPVDSCCFAINSSKDSDFEFHMRPLGPENAPQPFGRARLHSRKSESKQLYRANEAVGVLVLLSKELRNCIICFPKIIKMICQVFVIRPLPGQPQEMKGIYG